MINAKFKLVFRNFFEAHEEFLGFTTLQDGYTYNMPLPNEEGRKTGRASTLTIFPNKEEKHFVEFQENVLKLTTAIVERAVCENDPKEKLCRKGRTDYVKRVVTQRKEQKSTSSLAPAGSHHHPHHQHCVINQTPERVTTINAVIQCSFPSSFSPRLSTKLKKMIMENMKKKVGWTPKCMLIKINAEFYCSSPFTA